MDAVLDDAGAGEAGGAPAGGGRRVGRHSVTLPPAPDSPRSARRFVLNMLGDDLDPDALDAALLLVTELVTNVVVHAGTEAVVDVVRDSGGVWVAVADRHPVRIGAGRGGAGHAGEATPPPALGGLREDGRGLALVDALAHRWGTEHGSGGKTVWFRIGAAPPQPAPGAETGGPPARAVAGAHGGGPVAPAPARPSRPPRLLARDLARALSAEDETAELLAQLVDALPVSGGMVCRPSAYGTEPEVVAVMGRTGPAEDALSFPLDPTQNALGELRLWAGGAQPTATPLTARSGKGSIPDQSLRDGPGPRIPPAEGEQSSTAQSGRENWRSLPPAEGERSSWSDPMLLDTDEDRIRLVTRWMALALGGGDMRRAEERRIGMLSFLAEASDLLAGSLDVAHSLALLARLPVPRLARWCAVYLRRENDEPVLSAVGHADESGSGAVWEAAGDQAGELFAQVRAARDDEVRTVAALGGPALVVALRARRRVLGALVLGRAPGSAFAPDEIDLLVDLARRAAFAVDNARLYSRQVEVSQTLQAGLRPPELPRIDGLDLGSAYRAAQTGGLDVGGDFFDLVAGDRGWTIAIGDVCGKGAEAATVTGVARAVLGVLTGQGYELGDILVELNRALRDTSATLPAGQGRFCTLAAATVRTGPAGAGCVMSLRLAGHPPPVLLRADGSATFAGRPGTLLGVLDDDDASFPVVDVPLGPGEALVLYTDGVVEARRDRELFGDGRLLDVVSECAGMSAQGIADRVRRTAERFAGGVLRDDVAILVARVPA